MNIALTLPSGVQIRRRLGGEGKEAVAWPRYSRRAPFFSPSRVVRSRSISASGSPEVISVPAVPLRSRQLVALPKRTGVEIFGKSFTKDFGIRIAPLKHNWGYSVSPGDLAKLIDPLMGVGFLRTMEHFSGVANIKPQNYTITNDVNVLHQRFRDDFLPMLDDGLRRMTIQGSATFLLQVFLLGLHLGFSPGYLFYVLFQIANTEGLSYLVHEYTPGQFSGNSMFMYANIAVSWLYVSKSGFNSSWMLLLLALYGLFEFVAQFRVRAASKRIHFIGMFLGWLGYLFFL